MKLKNSILALTLLLSVGASVAVTHSIKNDQEGVILHAVNDKDHDTILLSGETIKIMQYEKGNPRCVIQFSNEKKMVVLVEELQKGIGDRSLRSGQTWRILGDKIQETSTKKEEQKTSATAPTKTEEKEVKATISEEDAAGQTTKESPVTADTENKAVEKDTENATFPPKIKVITKATAKGKSISYNVADIYDVRTVYKDSVNKANCFLVMSKQEYRLYVYEVTAKDTALVATYPVCYAKYTQQKQRSGDRTTPECDMKGAFRIMQIQDYSGRTHDFGDGRGAIKSYGKWFMRLDLSKGTGCNSSVRANTTIGIHGSTNNRESVPGNDSEGCIRLRDEDIIHLKEHYAQVGTKVVVKPYDTGRYAFEKKAIKRLGDRFFNAKKGYKKYPEPTK